VDILKIDRAFIEDLAHPSGRAILRAIASVADDLGLVTVAEGVETAEQLDVVRDAGVDSVQGYLFSAPRPFDSLRDTLHRLSPVNAVR
jgi:EAL domain-containing protein (putative c-di-GMP-specific phosphodiesterase class I)